MKPRDANYGRARCGARRCPSYRDDASSTCCVFFACRYPMCRIWGYARRVPTFAGNRTLKTVAINFRRTLPVALLVSLLCGCERPREPRSVTVSKPINRPHAPVFESRYDAALHDAEAIRHLETPTGLQAVPRTLIPKRARDGVPSSTQQMPQVPKVATSATGGTAATDQSVESARFEALSWLGEPEPATRSSAVPASNAPPAAPLTPAPRERPPTSFLPNGDG